VIDMSYPTMNVYGVDFATLAQKVQQDLAKVNVKLNLVPETFAVWQQQNADGKIGGTFGYWAPDYFGTSDYIKYFGLTPGTFVANASGLGKLPEGLNKKGRRICSTRRWPQAAKTPSSCSTTRPSRW
jgi:peptide/nickel transport system substrate-binding protein